MEPPDAFELDNVARITSPRHAPKTKRRQQHAGDDTSSNTSQEDPVTGRKSPPLRAASPKSDLEDGWNLVEDDLDGKISPEPKSPRTLARETPKKESKSSNSSTVVRPNLAKSFTGAPTCTTQPRRRPPVRFSNRWVCKYAPTEPPAFSHSPIWMMGHEFVLHPDEITDYGHGKKKHSKKRLPEHAERFLDAYVHLLFFSYRKDFPKLNYLHTSTDVGWGCMVRTGQMILAQVLSVIQQRTSSLSLEKSPQTAYSKERQLLRLFSDAPDVKGLHPYSIHCIIDKNTALYGIEKKDEQKNGIWFSPTKIAKVLKHLVRRHHPDALTMLVPTDGVIYVDKVISLCSTPPDDTDADESASNNKKARSRKSSRISTSSATSHHVKVSRIFKYQLLQSQAAEAPPSAPVSIPKPTKPLVPEDSVSASWIDVGSYHPLNSAINLKEPEPVRVPSNPQLASSNTTWNPFKTKSDDFDMNGNVDHQVVDHDQPRRSRSKTPLTDSGHQTRSRSSSHSNKAASDSDSELDSSLDTSDEAPDPDADRYLNGAGSGYFTPNGSFLDEEDIVSQPLPASASSVRKAKSNHLTTKSSSSSRRPSPDTPSTPTLNRSADDIVSNNKHAGSESNLLGSFSMSEADSSTRAGLDFPGSNPAQQPEARYWSIKFNQQQSFSESSQHPGSDFAAPSFTPAPNYWRPLFILIPRRLGLSKMNQVFLPHFKAIFRNPYSVGVIGGKPKASLYFVAYQDDEVVYLDPHIVKTAVSPDDEFTEDVYNSYHSKIPQTMHISGLDPSMAIGFLCRTLEEFEDFCNIHEQWLDESKCEAIFTIEEKSPDYASGSGILDDSTLSQHFKTPPKRAKASRRNPSSGGQKDSDSVHRTPSGKGVSSKPKSTPSEKRSAGGPSPHLSDEDDFVHT